MNSINNPEVADVFNRYPPTIQKRLMQLRQWIIDVATETEGVKGLEETLKWGEPSYLTQTGSTIRMGWKEKSPDQYALYFHCKTKLVDTFKEVYGDQFRFEGNRAIILYLDEEIPVDALKHCIALSLTYHLRKHLPLLGV